MKKRFMTVSLTLMAFSAFPFGIEIDTSQVKDKSIWGITGEIIQTKHIRQFLPKLGQPVHESITKSALAENDSSIFTAEGQDEVLKGVLFNDDPDGFLLPYSREFNPKGYSLLHEGTRWLVVFGKVASREYYINKTAELKEKIKKINEGYEFGDATKTALYSARLVTASTALATLNAEFALNPNMLYASHFGNLQFLHSMGTSDNSREEVLADVLDYIEYSWKLASGEVNHEAQSVKIDEVKKAHEETSDDLSIVENMIIKYPKSDMLFHSSNDEILRQRALGSILHIVQDSYAKGHTVREDWESSTSFEANSGKIRYFQSYSEQDGGKHGEHDTHDHGIEKWQDIPGAMTAFRKSSEIVKYFTLKCSYRNEFKIDDEQCPKDGMKSYFENEVFALAPYIDEEKKIIDYLNIFNQYDTSFTKSHESLK